MRKHTLFSSVGLLISVFLIPTLMIFYFKEWMVFPLICFFVFDVLVVGIFAIYIYELIDNIPYLGFNNAWKKFIKTAFYD